MDSAASNEYAPGRSLEIYHRMQDFKLWLEFEEVDRDNWDKEYTRHKKIDLRSLNGG